MLLLLLLLLPAYFCDRRANALTSGHTRPGVATGSSGTTVLVPLCGVRVPTALSELAYSHLNCSPVLLSDPALACGRAWQARLRVLLWNFGRQ